MATPPRLIADKDLKIGGFDRVADDWASRRGLSAARGGKANAAALGIDPEAIHMGQAPGGGILTNNVTALQWFSQLEAAAVATRNTVSTPASDTTSGLMTSSDKIKLDGVATGATKNASDEDLRNRQTHTGMQPISTVEGLVDWLSSLENLSAPTHSPGFSGTPTAPTPESATNNNQIATTAFVKQVIALLIAETLNNDPQFAQTISDQLAAKAPLLSPHLVGSPKAPTPNSNDVSTNIATTEFVVNALVLRLAEKLNLTGGTMQGPITFHDSQEFPKEKISQAIGVATLIKLS